MELLYVWVESYGNISRQGFNFSPNYWFEVDENNNLLDKTEERKKEGRLNEQPENFFGDNISNITAIVGKNGSGKSTILEILTKTNYYLISENKLFDKLFKIVIFDGNEIKIINSEDKPNKIEILSCLYYCEDWTRVVKNNLKNISFAKQIKEVEQEYWTVEKRETKDIISAVLIERVCHQLAFLEFLKEKDINNKFTRTFSKFEKIEINFRSFYMNKIKNEIEEIIFKNDKFNDSSEIGFLAKFLYLIFEYSLNEYKLIELSEELKKGENIEFLKGKIKLKEVNWNLLESLIKIDTLIVESEVENAKIEIESILKIHANELFEFFSIYFKKESIEGIENNENKFLLDNTNENRIRIKAISKYFKSIDISYSKEMSKGEYDTLSIFSNLYKEIIEKYNENVKNILILLDEPANSFHPEWQREFIRDFVEFSKLFKNKKLQLVLTSHSPFVASDLPRENVIMLNTDKDGNCIVRNDKKDKGIKTFGANIFDLYSDAFFVTSSFGEFAKGKIKEVVELLTYEEMEENKRKYNIDKDEYLIEKYEGDIKNIPKEIENLKKLIKRIENDDELILKKKDELKYLENKEPIEIVKERLKERIEYIMNSIGEKLVKNKLQKMYDEYRNYGKNKKTQIKIALKNLNLSTEEMNKILEAINND